MDSAVQRIAAEQANRVDITWGYICKCNSERSDVRARCYHRTIEADFAKALLKVKRAATRAAYAKARRQNEVEV